MEHAKITIQFKYIINSKKQKYEKDSFYNISNNNNYVGYYRENSKSYHAFEVKNSIIANCAKGDNFVKASV